MHCRKWYQYNICVNLKSKEPRLQGSALKPKFCKPKIEIPKSQILNQVQYLVRDDSEIGINPSCHASELVSGSDLLFFAFDRGTFYPRPCLPAGPEPSMVQSKQAQKGVLTYDLSKPNSSSNTLQGLEGPKVVHAGFVSASFELAAARRVPAVKIKCPS